ncbi:MAG TPA: SRPBCC domain-containing protein [Solirubrobacterales bacterium]|nr:SRPBCC domain-containing protein [Solirubrobacterales bacterium]
MSEDATRVVRIERSFDAPAEDVFDAWTSPEVMRRWYHAGPDWETPDVEVDLRVGGRVSVVMRKPDGSEVELSGEYVEIERPHRLAMTCTFSDDPSNEEQLIELSFSEDDGSTTVVLLNSRIPTEERRDSQRWGWDLCLVELERALAA